MEGGTQKKTLLIVAFFLIVSVQVFLHNNKYVMQVWASVTNQSNAAPLNDSAPLTEHEENTADIDVKNKNTSNITRVEGTLEVPQTTTDSSNTASSQSNYQNKKNFTSSQVTQQDSEKNLTSFFQLDGK